MIRIVVLAVLVVAVWLALRWLVFCLRKGEIDWTGMAFAAGFVAMAFWLRGMTGIG